MSADGVQAIDTYLDDLQTSLQATDRLRTSILEEKKLLQRQREELRQKADDVENDRNTFNSIVDRKTHEWAEQDEDMQRRERECSESIRQYNADREALERAREEFLREMEDEREKLERERLQFDVEMQMARAQLNVDRMTMQEEFRREKNRLYAAIAEERDVLEREKFRWRAMKRRLECQIEPLDDVLHVNVGGKLFTCARKILCMEPNSALAAMFSAWIHKTPKDREGRYFIARDPKNFETILNMLQSRWYGEKNEEQDDVELTDSLRQDLQFFGLQELYMFFAINQLTGEEYGIQYNASISVREAKRRISLQCEIPIAQIQLRIGDRILTDTKTMEESRVRIGMRVEMHVQLFGIEAAISDSVLYFTHDSFLNYSDHEKFTVINLIYSFIEDKNQYMEKKFTFEQVLALCQKAMIPLQQKSKEVLLHHGEKKKTKYGKPVKRAAVDMHNATEFYELAKMLNPDEYDWKPRFIFGKFLSVYTLMGIEGQSSQAKITTADKRLWKRWISVELDPDTASQIIGQRIFLEFTLAMRSRSCRDIGTCLEWLLSLPEPNNREPTAPSKYFECAFKAACILGRWDDVTRYGDQIKFVKVQREGEVLDLMETWVKDARAAPNHNPDFRAIFARASHFKGLYDRKPNDLPLDFSVWNIKSFKTLLIQGKARDSGVQQDIDDAIEEAAWTERIDDLNNMDASRVYIFGSLCQMITPNPRHPVVTCGPWNRHHLDSTGHSVKKINNILVRTGCQLRMSRGEYDMSGWRWTGTMRFGQRPDHEWDEILTQLYKVDVILESPD